MARATAVPGTNRVPASEVDAPVLIHVFYSAFAKKVRRQTSLVHQVQTSNPFSARRTRLSAADPTTRTAALLVAVPRF